MAKEKRELSPFVEAMLKKSQKEDPIAKPQTMMVKDVKRDPELKSNSLFMKDEDVKKVEKEVKRMQDSIK